MAEFCDCCTCELKTTAPPPLDATIGAIFQVIKRWESPIYSTASLLFSLIVAVVEVEVSRQHAPKVDFRQFHE